MPIALLLPVEQLYLQHFKSKHYNIKIMVFRLYQTTGSRNGLKITVAFSTFTFGGLAYGQMQWQTTCYQLWITCYSPLKLVQRTSSGQLCQKKPTPSMYFHCRVLEQLRFCLRLVTYLIFLPLQRTNSQFDFTIYVKLKCSI